MYKKLSITLYALLFILISGCGAPEPGTSSETEPEWMGLDGSEEGLYASGSSLASSRSGAVTAATTVALQSLASKMGTQVQGLAEQFNSELNTRAAGEVDVQGENLTEQVTRTMTNQTIRGYSVDKRSVKRYSAAEYEAFIRLKLTSKSVAQMKAAVLESALSDDEEMLTRFKKSEAFKRLEEQLKKTQE